jgi:hypothetical protein
LIAAIWDFTGKSNRKRLPHIQFQSGNEINNRLRNSRKDGQFELPEDFTLGILNIKTKDNILLVNRLEHKKIDGTSSFPTLCRDTLLKHFKKFFFSLRWLLEGQNTGRINRRWFFLKGSYCLDWKFRLLYLMTSSFGSG